MSLKTIFFKESLMKSTCMDMAYKHFFGDLQGILRFLLDINTDDISVKRFTDRYSGQVKKLLLILK